MDHDSRNRLSPEARAVNVAAASGADMVVNFPLWIAAKRLSAGLPLPRLGEIYKGSGALYLAFFPMMVVEDWATGVVDRTLGGRLGDESRHLVSACASGPAAAVLVGSQVEGLITRAHGVGQSLGRSLMATAAAEGWVSLLVPHGMLMVAAREVPYAGCLFFLSAKIRAALEPPEGAAAPLATRVPRDMLAAVLCACVAGPLSQVPCTIAAYQQAHALGIAAACRAIHRTGLGFFAGLTARTASLAGSLFVFPFTMEELQPVAERLFPQR